METNRQADTGRYKPSDTARQRQIGGDSQAKTDKRRDRLRQKSGATQARKDRHGKTGIYGKGVYRLVETERKGQIGIGIRQ